MVNSAWTVDEGSKILRHLQLISAEAHDVIMFVAMLSGALNGRSLSTRLKQEQDKGGGEGAWHLPRDF